MTRMPVGRDQLLSMLEYSIEPLVLALSLWVVAFWMEGYLSARYVVLSVIVFSVTFPGPSHLMKSPWSVFRHIIAAWLAISGLLGLFVWASGYLRYFSIDVLLNWWWVAPSSQLVAHFLLRIAAPAIIDLQGQRRRAIVAGMNAQGIELAERMADDPYTRVRVVGFFDDRSGDRIEDGGKYPLLGKIGDLSLFAKNNRVDLIYIALPMVSQPRILALLDQLHDTTSSIYFVPDIFVTDLIQGRIDSIGGMPVVAVCETPFTGFNGVTKRVIDICVSSLVLALIFLPLLLVALAIKLGSPGPAIFRQRRYGLDGREFIVYKLRTMTVVEDGAVIEQARKVDARVTVLGRFLRKASLDELPQFVNVLQGRMSIVGPRPHAVAHNEMYRKLIKGYMLRHKVKPGITGWAQVNGYRGETETLDKMKARIDYDLDYLRNWSLRLDFYIMARTVWVVLKEVDAH